MFTVRNWMLWHRRLGTWVAPIILMLSITGILINYSQDLGWGSSPIYSRIIGHLYGVNPPKVQSGFKAGTKWIYQSGDQILVDQLPLTHCTKQLQSGGIYQEYITILCNNQIFLFDENGEIIEVIRDVPAKPNRLSAAPGGLIVEANNEQYFWSEMEGTWAKATPEANPSWYSEQSIPSKTSAKLTNALPLPGISKERFVLDLHSGRLFGGIGTLVINLTGVITCVLAFSGFLSWMKRKFKKRK